MFDTIVPDNLEDIPPGAQLAQALDSVDWDRLSNHDLVRVLQAQQRQVSHYQAGRAWTIDKVVERYQGGSSNGAVDSHEAVRGAAAEVGAALSLTRRTADLDVAFSVELLRRRRGVFEALLFGRIDIPRARVMVEETLHVTDTIADTALEALLPEAPALTTGQLRHRISKLCVDADPEAARKRYERSVADRRLELRPTCSGTADLVGMDLPPHIAASVNRWIHREALKLKSLGDDRTMDQLRADIYLDLLRMRYKGKKMTRADIGNIDIRLTAETLTGQSDESADLNGFGPVIADIARQVAESQEQVRQRWLLIDPDTRQPIDGGLTRRRPTMSQRRRAEMAHPTCIHPGCRMPSIDCDIDHRQPWNEHRVTCTADLGPMCRHHHVTRHRFGWTYRPAPGGDFIFTSPFGHEYSTSGQPARARAP